MSNHANPVRRAALLIPALLVGAHALPCPAQDAKPGPPLVLPVPEPAAPPWPYKDPLAMMQRSVLPNVTGRIDHMAADPQTGRLFVAAIRNGSLEVLDIQANMVVQSITGLAEPQGVVYVPELRRLVVSCGGDGACRVYQADGAGVLAESARVQFSGEADNLRYDGAAKRVYVAHGRAIGSFDPKTGEKGPDAALDGQPEAFELDPKARRIYVNIAAAGHVAVIDRDKDAVTATWILDGAKSNFPMALDAERARLFVACRQPAKLLVLDTASGKTIATLDCPPDADDIWYDGATRRILITGGGGGKIASIKQESADAYTPEFTMTTAAGARTSLLIPEQRRFIVAAPKLEDDPAFIFIYLIGP